MVSWSSERGRCRQFTLAEIEKATDSFSGANFLGRGGEGMVFKGIIAADAHKSTSHVAVKRLNKSGLGERQLESFDKEIQMLSEIRHANLVSLIGYCQESNEHLLVYEFISNGNLRNKLEDRASPLTYEQRIIICRGAARAIEYLHCGTSLNSKIIHRDIKPENILLTDKLEAKVSDFGLSRIVAANQTHSTVTTLRLCGTAGYYAPEYYNTGNFTWRVDVYAFGVVLIEVLCKKKPLQNRKDSTSFKKWVIRNIDPVLKKEVSQSSLEKFISAAEKCLNKDPYKRPQMNEVVVMLDSALELQKSKFVGEKRPVDSESSSSSSISICDFKRTKSDKFEMTSSDHYSDNFSSSVIPGTTWQESNDDETTREEVTNLIQESRVYKSLGESELRAEDSIYSYPSMQIEKLGKQLKDSGHEEMESKKDETNTSSNSSASAILPDIPSTQDKVVLYYGGDVTDYMKTLLYLNKFGVEIEERDPKRSKDVETELSQFLSQTHKEFSLPQLFIGGKHIGGAEEVVRLYDTGELRQYLEVYSNN